MNLGNMWFIVLVSLLLSSFEWYPNKNFMKEKKTLERSLWKYLPHSVDHLFILLVVSSLCINVFVLCCFTGLFLLLLPLPLESGPGKHCQEWCQWTYCLLPSRSCMISGHILEAFWINFCVWCKTTAIFGKAHL